MREARCRTRSGRRSGGAEQRSACSRSSIHARYGPAARSTFRRCAFNPLNHLLVGWVIGNIGPSTRASRTWCLIASLAPDVDGLVILLGKDMFLKYHHQLTHNLLFAVLLAALSSRWLGWCSWQVPRVFACVLVHFLGDYYGSGPGWPLPLFVPFSDTVILNPSAWAFNGWQSQLVFATTLIFTLVIARKGVRTPLESVSAGMDTMFSDLAVLGFGTRCECGRRALYRCHQCRVARCSRDVKYLGFGRVLCAECAEAGDVAPAGASTAAASVADNVGDM
ncbi:MAG: metal-dependent hydrolase [Candidatus Riflebacteria bacterium]|nr:metal-dependent hydrolase [Candidatus Riflebacteria bacterium]